jgi:DNA-binding NarL/FixJ family response regulator
MMQVIRLFLVDDERQVRRGLRMRLGMEPDIVVVGEAEDGATALELIVAAAPDVVLMDVNLGELDGISTASRLRDLSPRSAVVMLSIQDDSRTRERAMLAGARAFVGKHDIDSNLTGAIRAAAASVAAPEGGRDLT